MGEVGLIPIDIAAIAATLVVLEGIGQHTTIGTDAEVVAGVGRKDNTTRHRETVQITANVACGSSYLLEVKIVTRSE